MSAQLWVQHRASERTIRTIGPIGPIVVFCKRCKFVGELIIILSTTSRLHLPGDSEITLYQPDGATAMHDADSPSVLIAGNSSKSPLIVSSSEVLIPSSTMEPTLHSKVENLGVSCEISAMNHILNGDIDTILALASPSLTSEIAQAIINNVKSQIKTATQKAIGEKH